MTERERTVRSKNCFGFFIYLSIRTIKSMNIVYVSDQYWPSISGVSVSIDAFRKELLKMGHTVFLLVPDYPNAMELDKKMNVEK